jgi:glycosyltransferase involved in cell wall biosynthesis
VTTVAVSVVMPAWRVPQAWLRTAVASVLDDTCALELVVVDDGNDEPLGATLGDGDDARLRVVRIEHGGQGAALEAGLRAARGAYVRFADADDAAVAGSTTRLLDRAAGRDDVIAYGATVLCDEQLRPVRTLVSNVSGDARIDCLLGRFEVRHVSMLFPRRVVDLAGPWSAGLRVSGDWDFVLRALDHAQVEGDARPATFYRRHGRSLTGGADVETGERDRRLVLDGFFARHPELRGTRLERQARAAMLLDRAHAYAAAGEAGRAADRLRRGARLAPAAGVRAGLDVVGALARRRLRDARRAR